MLSRQCGNPSLYQGNGLARNSPGNARPQASQLAVPLWTDLCPPVKQWFPQASQLAVPLWTDLCLCPPVNNGVHSHLWKSVYTT